VPCGSGGTTSRAGSAETRCASGTSMWTDWSRPLLCRAATRSAPYPPPRGATWPNSSCSPATEVPSPSTTTSPTTHASTASSCCRTVRSSTSVMCTCSRKTGTSTGASARWSPGSSSPTWRTRVSSTYPGPSTSTSPNSWAPAGRAITVRNILDMTSGIACEESAEAYADIESCMLVMERSVGLNPELPTVSFRDHMAAIPSGIEQGTRYDYASANTSMLMYLAEELTGRRIPTWCPSGYGARSAPKSEALIVSGDYAKGEAAAAHGGLVTTLRDLGRLGLFMLEQESFTGSSSTTPGRPSSRRLLGRLRDSRRPSHARGMADRRGLRRRRFRQGRLGRTVPVRVAEPEPGRRVVRDLRRRFRGARSPVGGEAAGHALRARGGGPWPRHLRPGPPVRQL
jgi:hypothetical protein